MAEYRHCRHAYQRYSYESISNRKRWQRTCHCRKNQRKPSIEKLYAAPGSDGMSSIAECIPYKVTDVTSIVDFAVKEKIDMVFIGPEVPLLLGMADALLEKESWF